MTEFIFQENGPLGLAMSDKDWQVAPGDKITIPALVANRGANEIYVAFTVQGVPVDWITLDKPVVRLSPMEKQEVNVTISPPPFPQCHAGEYPLEIRANLQSQPEIMVKVRDTMTVAAFNTEGRIGVLVASVQYSVAPGGSIDIPLTLVNRGIDPDSFRLNVKGISTEWITTATPSARLAPAESQEIQFKITVPRSSLIDAGRNSFTIEIVSENHPNQKSEVNCIMTVAVFTQFSVTMLVPSLNANQTGSISIKNDGNAKEAYLVSFEDQANKLVFEKVVKIPKENASADKTGKPEFKIEFVEVKVEESISVAPGETGVFEFRARPRSREFLGGETSQPFLAHVQSVANKQKKSLEGQIISKAILPAWGVVLILLLLTCLCLYMFVSRKESQQSIGATQTAAVNQTQAVINGGEDTDGDGISNNDEIAKGTDPQNADSDGDELKDGEEVFTYLTDPLKPDSDSDGLTDGEEVLRQSTNPILPDTDGDTLTDGDEVRRKTNPLLPDTDADGIKDGDETRFGTDPVKPDTDNDGLLDGQENQTCPNYLNPDSDSDGIVDGKDANPCDPGNPFLTSSAPTVPPVATPLPPTGIPPTIPATAPTEVEAPNLHGLIIFESNRDGNPEIYSLNLDDSSQVRLTSNAAVDMQPALSPNGQDVVFVSNRDGNNEIYLSGINRQAPINLSNNPADEQYPVWSPDGNWIAFTTNRDGNNEIYVMKKDGTEVHNISQNPAGDSYPSWFSGPGALSVDEWIAFTTNRDGNNEIYRMRKDGSEVMNLTQNGANDYSPAGYASTIAFVSDRDGNPEIYTMKVDGKSQVNITANPGQDLDPTFSANSNWVAFASDREGNLDIYVIQTNGKDLYNYTKNPGQDKRPSWR
jgi:hypothetical protein